MTTRTMTKVTTAMPPWQHPDPEAVSLATALAGVSRRGISNLPRAWLSKPHQLHKVSFKHILVFVCVCLYVCVKAGGGPTNRQFFVDSLFSTQ